MGAWSSIEWTHHTFNPWRGCAKVSEGCAHCYAEALSRRNPKVLGTWGPHGARPLAADAYWRRPLQWDRAARQAGERRRVFCASLADWLEDREDLDGPRARLLAMIDRTPHLDWLLLSKRPENFRPLLERAWKASREGGLRIGDLVGHWLDGVPPANVWAGTSVESRRRLLRASHLMEIPAVVRFLSVEPLLEDLGPLWKFGADRPDRCVFKLEVYPFSGLFAIPDLDWEVGRISWVIVGGESGQGGAKARPCDVAWVRAIVAECKQSGVACFVKQLGSRPLCDPGEMIPGPLPMPYSPCGRMHVQPRDSHGGDPAEWPEDLRVREFPTPAVPGGVP